MESKPATSDAQPMTEFYLPAMGVRPRVPGRLKLAVTRLFRNRDTPPPLRGRRERVRQSYLPAVVQRQNRSR